MEGWALSKQSSRYLSSVSFPWDNFGTPPGRTEGWALSKQSSRYLSSVSFPWDNFGTPGRTEGWALSTIRNGSGAVCGF